MMEHGTPYSGAPMAGDETRQWMIHVCDTPHLPLGWHDTIDDTIDDDEAMDDGHDWQPKLKLKHENRL